MKGCRVRAEVMEDSSVMSDEGHAIQLRWTRGIAGFLALGVMLRLVRALQNYPMWCDETMLAANLLDRDWTELARPLDYRQVCPLGFLAIEWIAVRVAGFSELSLRVFPLLCSLASVPLFHRLARLILGRGTAGTFLAVAVFAVSEPLIRYAGEAKPYETDLMVSLGLLCLSVEWLAAPWGAKGLWKSAVLAPLAVAVSLPSLFVIGGIGSVGFYELLKRRSVQFGLGLAAFVTTAGLAIAAMAAAGQYRSSPGDRAYFLRFWAGAFPPSITEPASLVRWLLRVSDGPLFAFPHGADTRLAWLTPVIFGCFVLGTILLLRDGKSKVALLILPILLTLAAAALRRYPFGISARVNLYLVPVVLVFAAKGCAWVCSKAAPMVARRRMIVGLGCVLAVFAAFRLSGDLGHPYRAPWDRTGREFARWFWEEMPAGGEVVCVQSDLGIPFGPKRWAYDGADQYLCYQRIYSRRHREGGSPQWDRVSAERPLLCVLLSRLPEEVPGFKLWIDEHRDRYTLKAVHSYPATRGSAVEPKLVYVVCEFVPSSRVTGSSGVDGVRAPDGAVAVARGDSPASQASLSRGRSGGRDAGVLR